MRVPIIIVRDKFDSRLHLVGSESHDSLQIYDDGNLHYYNYQNGEGSGGDYKFIGLDYEIEEVIEFVELENYEKRVNELLERS